MDEIITWIWSVSYWHWWAIAVALIALEVLAPTTYFLWPGAAAAATGLIVWIFPGLDWRIQILVFAVLSVVSVFAWNRWWKKQRPKDEAPTLNVRTERYVGRRITLGDALENGRGRAQIDDSWWQLASEDGEAIEAGATVEVVSSDSTTLIVRR